MAFVLDASITACWAFRDEDHPDASLALDQMRSEEPVVPCLWWFEVRNILVVNERRRRIAEAHTVAFLLNLSRFRIRVDLAKTFDHRLDKVSSGRVTTGQASEILDWIEECRRIIETQELATRVTALEQVRMVETGRGSDQKAGKSGGTCDSHRILPS
jgi:hypothetical protein